MILNQEQSGTGNIQIGEARDVNITQIVHEAARYVPTATYQLRAVDAHFTGREEELAAIVRTLRAARGGIATISNLQGMGGVGKTELALLAAHALAAEYPDAQLLVELGTHSPAPLTAQAALEKCIRAFYPTAKLPADARELRDIYIDTLQGKRALVILDDARDDAQVRELLPPPGCAVIVTARHALRCGTRLNLEVLPRPQAMELLARLCPRLRDARHLAGDGHLLDALAKRCGDLPVALQVAGGFLHVYETVEPADYLRDLRLASLGDDERDVTAIFAYSYDRLAPALQAAWRALAVMPADFARAAGEAIIGDADAPPSTVYRPPSTALDELVRLSLLQYEAASQRFRWHDLLREFALEKLRGAGDEYRAAALRHADHYIAVAYEAQQLYMQGGDNMLAGLAQFDRARAHIEAAFEWLGGMKENPARLVRLVGAVAHTSDLRFHPEERIRWLTAQRAAARTTGDRGNEGNALTNLGSAYYVLGQPHRAIKCYEQALRINREIGDRRGEGAALGNLGVAYKNLGQPHRAIEYHEQALDIDREIGDRHGEGKDLTNLGIAYKNLGQPYRAIEYHEQALDIDREIGDRHGEGNVLGNLGVTYRHLGQPGRAIEYFEQWLELAREINDRYGEGNALGNLGSAYSDLGQPRRAIEYTEQSLTLHRETGNRHREGIALGNLGLAYAALGASRRAIEYYELALGILHEVGSRRDEAIISWQVGLVYEKLGDVARAVELMQVCVDYEQEVGHPDAERDAVLVKELLMRSTLGELNYVQDKEQDQKSGSAKERKRQFQEHRKANRKRKQRETRNTKKRRRKKK